MAKHYDKQFKLDAVIHSHCDYMSPNDYEELYRRLQHVELQMAG